MGLGESLTPGPSPEGRGGNAGGSGSSAGFSIVVAMDRNRGIGNKGDLPWPKLKGDMKFFRELTTCPDRAAVEKRWGLKAEESAETKSWEDVSAMLKFAHPLPSASDEKRNAVIMGRKTWESLPESYRPLPERFNGVLSKSNTGRAYIGHKTWHDLGNAFFELRYGVRSPDQSPNWFAAPIANEIFVIGGGQIFRWALQDPDCHRLYVTEIESVFPRDTFFPETPDFHPVLSSPWIEENGIRYRFRRYDRT